MPDQSLLEVEETDSPLDLDGDPTLRRDRHVAVVDIGSNSVRLVVYEALSRAPLPRFNEKSLCELGAELDRTGKLGEEAMAATQRAMRRYAAIARAMDVEQIDVIATEALRRASNGEKLVEAIAKETGLEPRILSGGEEARLAAHGVIAGFYRPRGMVGDMGGGSVDIAEVIDHQVGERKASLPLGALPVNALLEEHGKDTKEAVDKILADKLPPPITEPTFYCVGGGWRALARIHMAINDVPVKVAHGYEIDAKELRAFAKKVWRMDRSEITDLPDVPSRRIKTLAASALVLERIIKKMKFERIIFSAFGVREGWLYDQLPAEERSQDPLIEGAQAFGAPRSRVPSFAAALVRWTDTLFTGESHGDKRLRVAACALSDIAWGDHPNVQAHQSFQRVIGFPFTGIDHTERVFLGVVIHARYGGAPDDPELNPAIDLLSQAQIRRARILGKSLVLAHRFSGSVPEILDSAHLRIETDHLTLEVTNTAFVPDSDAVRTRMKQLAKTMDIRRTDIVVIQD